MGKRVKVSLNQLKKNLKEVRRDISGIINALHGDYKDLPALDFAGVLTRVSKKIQEAKRILGPISGDRNRPTF
jgi:hypothetical protein